MFFSFLESTRPYIQHQSISATSQTQSSGGFQSFLPWQNQQPIHYNLTETTVWPLKTTLSKYTILAGNSFFHFKYHSTLSSLAHSSMNIKSDLSLQVLVTSRNLEQVMAAFIFNPISMKFTALSIFTSHHPASLWKIQHANNDKVLKCIYY